MLSIRFGDFFVLRGILLSLSRDTIRVALEDCGDAAEFRRVEKGWISEDNQSVEIEWQPEPHEELFPLPLTPRLDRPSAHSCIE